MVTGRMFDSILQCTARAYIVVIGRLLKAVFLCDIIMLIIKPQTWASCFDQSFISLYKLHFLVSFDTAPPRCSDWSASAHMSPTHFFRDVLSQGNYVHIKYVYKNVFNIILKCLLYIVLCEKNNCMDSVEQICKHI